MSVRTEKQILSSQFEKDLNDWFGEYLRYKYRIHIDWDPKEGYWDLFLSKRMKKGERMGKIRITEEWIKSPLGRELSQHFRELLDNLLESEFEQQEET